MLRITKSYLTSTYIIETSKTANLNRQILRDSEKEADCNKKYLIYSLFYLTPAVRIYKRLRVLTSTYFNILPVYQNLVYNFMNSK